jgi:hypothetical protein
MAPRAAVAVPVLRRTVVSSRRPLRAAGAGASAPAGARGPEAGACRRGTPRRPSANRVPRRARVRVLRRVAPRRSLCLSGTPRGAHSAPARYREAWGGGEGGLRDLEPVRATSIKRLGRCAAPPSSAAPSIAPSSTVTFRGGVNRPASVQTGPPQFRQARLSSEDPSDPLRGGRAVPPPPRRAAARDREQVPPGRGVTVRSATHGASPGRSCAARSAACAPVDGACASPRARSTRAPGGASHMRPRGASGGEARMSKRPSTCKRYF